MGIEEARRLTEPLCSLAVKSTDHNETEALLIVQGQPSKLSRTPQQLKLDRSRFVYRFVGVRHLCCIFATMTPHD